MEVRGLTVHDNLSLIQVNHTLRIRSISQCVEINYVFIYLIFRPSIFTYAIETVTPFITYTIVIILYLYLVEKNYSIIGVTFHKGR